MQNSVESAIKKGLEEIVFTDHFETLNRSGKLEDVIDYGEYSTELNILKDKYSKIIDIKLGAEINLQHDRLDEMNSTIREYNFDFVIGSLHLVDYCDVGISQYYRGLTCDEYHTKYFKDLLKMLENDFSFSVLGHLDFVTRYGGYKNNFVDLKIQYEYVEQILKKIILMGRGIEINTSALRYGKKEFHPSSEIIRLYKELGGEIVTVGSDSHNAETIAYNFDMVEKFLLDSGFKYYTIFKNMKPEFVKLG